MSISLDIIGKRYGRLVAIEFHHRKEYKRATVHFWKFKCDCGEEKVIKKRQVVEGHTKSCGCIKYGVKIDYIPEGSRLKFIRQTSLASNVLGKHKMAKALYECSCGTIKEFIIAKVKSGWSRSCGCWLKDFPAIKHGLSKHPLYRIFHCIKARCYNPNNPAYNDYGGRGVEICNQWLLDPSEFVKWGIENGWNKNLNVDKDIKARGLGIDALMYSPERCQFVSTKVNNNAKRNNRLIELNGIVKTLAQWSDKTGIKASTIHLRIKHGWSIDEALTKPVNSKNKAA